jgi:hypothetical protein
MGEHVRIALLVGLCVLSACGRKPPRAEPIALPAPAAVLSPPEAFYDRDGNIKGSGTRVQWLEIPVGFTRSAVRSTNTREIYEATRLPFEKVCDFLSRRMFTGKVDRGTNHAEYPAVMPLDMNESAIRLNVSLTQVEGVLALAIEPVPRPNAKPLSDEEARRLLREEAEHMH